MALCVIRYCPQAQLQKYLCLAGTYGYMAPEQFRGAAQPASDLYALGGTLLFLLSGTCSFFTHFLVMSSSSRIYLLVHCNCCWLSPRSRPLLGAIDALYLSVLWLDQAFVQLACLLLCGLADLDLVQRQKSTV